MMSCDVAVVGGGPSGLHAARRLAERGRCVSVFERKASVGQGVVCTGIIGLEAFADFDLPEEGLVGSLSTMALASPSGRRLTYRHPRVFARVVNRQAFDRGLAAAAVRAGAALAVGAEVEDIEVNADGAVLSVRAAGRVRRVKAGAVLLATGIDHQMSLRLDLGVPRRYLLGAQAEIRTEDGAVPTLFVGRDLAPGGFGWAIPGPAGRVRLGLVSEREPRRHFPRLLRAFGPDLPLPPSIAVKPIAQGLVSRTFADRVLVVGEAAGQVKTTTGGGISYGLLCAEIAADVLDGALRSGSPRARVLAEYERRWKAALKKEIRTGLQARRLFARLTDGHMEKIFELAQTDGLVPLVQREGRFDWHSGLIAAVLRNRPVLGLLKDLGRISLLGDRPRRS